VRQQQKLGKGRNNHDQRVKHNTNKDQQKHQEQNIKWWD